MVLELLAWSFSIWAAAKLGGRAFGRRCFVAELQQLLDLVKIFKLRLEIRTLSFNLTLPRFEPMVSRWHKTQNHSVLLFCSNSLPKDKARWVRLTLCSLWALFYAVLSKNFSNINKRFLGMLRIEPVAAGWEAGMIPLCCTVPYSVLLRLARYYGPSISQRSHQVKGCYWNKTASRYVKFPSSLWYNFISVR